MDKINPKFEASECGTISFGPTSRFMCNLVKYRDEHNRLKYYCDLRIYSYSADSNRFMPSRKGITLSSKLVLAIHNWLVNLGDPPPNPVEDGNVEQCRFEKYRNTQVVCSFVKGKDGPSIDIREFNSQEGSNHYGYQSKGCRFSFHSKDDVDNMLMTCYNAMIDLDNARE